MRSFGLFGTATVEISSGRCLSVGEPGAWTMALGGLAACLPLDAPGGDLIIMSAAFALLDAPRVGLWATGAMSPELR